VIEKKERCGKLGAKRGRLCGRKGT